MEKQNLGQGLAKWLPSRGNMLFTVLVIGMLFLAQANGLFTLAKSASAPADMPQLMPYQGRLADASGNPLTGTYPMTFRLYDSPGIGDYPLWTENYIGPNSIKVSNGLFNVMLGSLTPISHTLLQEHGTLWLGITVGTDNEMTPRVQLGSAPYAFSANYAANGVPSGSILIMTGATCPVGYTRVQALDGKFLRGAASYGGTGGSETHTHTATTAGDHTHTITTGGAHEHYQGITSPVGFEPLSSAMGNKTTQDGAHDHGGATGTAGGHTHTVSSGSNLPPYVDVLFCQKD